MILVENLHFQYPGSKHNTLKALNFEVKKGEIFGFLGPSAAGKSTTQKILIGLLKDYRGLINIMGKDLKQWKSDYYEKIGVSFEMPNHYLKLTALENLNYFRQLYSGETEDPQSLLEMVNLGQDGSLRVSQFSKGMKIRLNVARSLLHKPELIFMDEPTAGLDPVNARMIIDLIHQKKTEGKTIFLTTHNMNVADELCDRVAFIVDGEIRLIDFPRVLKLLKGQKTVKVEYLQNDQVLHKEFSLPNIGHNEQFIQLLRDNEIQTIHSQETTLEKIFIETTGRALI